MRIKSTLISILLLIYLSTKEAIAQNNLSSLSIQQITEINKALKTELSLRIFNLYSIISEFPKNKSEEPISDPINTKCIKKIQNLLQSFRAPESINTFIQGILNSGKGINQFGNYFACKEDDSSRFIMFDIIIFETVIAGVGLCGPSECLVGDYNSLKSPLFKLIYPILAPLLADFGIPLTQENIQFTDVKERNEGLLEYHAGNILTILFCSILLLVVVVATTIDYLKNIRPKEICNSNIDNTHPWYMNFLYSFSANINIRGILYSKNKIDTNLNVLNGTRVLSMGWIIMGHVLEASALLPTTNNGEVLSLIHNYAGMSIFTSATVAVDVFFALSGFLAVFSFIGVLQAPNPPGRKVIIILQGYLHRYIRLLAIYVLGVVTIMYILPLTYDNPLTPDLRQNIHRCQESVWKNFLYVNNIWDNDMCMSWTWYLATDMQFFLLSPWIAWLYLASKKLAIYTLLVMILISAFIQSIIISYYNIQLSFIGNNGPFDYYYYRPWCRVNTYLLGILFLWLYLSHKRREHLYQPFQLINRALDKPLVRYMSFILGVSLCTLIVFTGSFWYMSPENITTTDNIVYGIFHMPAFVLGVFLIIYPVLLGHFRPILAILGHEVFSAMARITYGAYMFHIHVLTFIAVARNQAIYFSVGYLLYFSIDIFILSYLISFFLSLLFESPMLQIEKKFLLAGRKPVQGLQSPMLSPRELGVGENSLKK